MPKFRRGLSIFLALWLCVMLITFTYTWVSRNWTPSIKGDNIDIASSGALLIKLQGDDPDIQSKVNLNDVVGLEVDSSFTFRQVSSQDGITFFRKEFYPKVDGVEPPSKFWKIEEGTTYKKDYIDTKFCLMLDDSLEEPKYVFIHPDTMIQDNTVNRMWELNKAIRISLTYEKKIGTQTVTETVILADLGDDNTGMAPETYMAVKPDADGKTDEEGSGALGRQYVYGLQYYNCGRQLYDSSDPYSEANYSFTRDESRALFKLEPGETKWVYMRIWLEGQDYNCEKEIAGESFNMFLKFDSAFVKAQSE